MEDKLGILRRYFGYSAFREGQEELIDGVLSGRDVFGIMPTGGGKSICYQLPALMLPGVTLVVSPLISLMKDQVMALTALGVPAAFINSSQTSNEARAVYSGLRRGAYKLIYVAPERLETEGFVSAAQSADVSLLAVDEAHCISQWGQDFRPSYLRIPDFIRRLPRRPAVAALTATATAQVREDVERLLALRSPIRVVTGFDRPNLRFDVLTPKDKNKALLGLLSRFSGKSGIVYCATRKTVESVCDTLRVSGFPATRYHAGLEDSERRRNQEDFIFDRAPIMVATNAFGMGIDKSNVGFVIHYNMPKSLEAYYQEAGRAGRDGAPADCVVLFSRADVRTCRFLIESSSENPDLADDERLEIMSRDYARLESMTGYCETKGCFRAYILSYFGQTHAQKCSNCGNCSARFESVDITQEAQMVLSCIQRIRDRLGYYVGKTTVIKCLAGSRDKGLLSLGLDGISTYGLLRAVKRERLNGIFAELQAQGYIVTESRHGTVRPTAAARNVLFHGESVTMSIRTQAPAKPARPASRSSRRAPAPVLPEPVIKPDAGANGLLEALKLLRLKIARKEGVPLYVVFSNATLDEMVRLRPETMEEFMNVSGVGTVKARRYGELFIDAIRSHGR